MSAGVLLDTSVLSLLAPGRLAPDHPFAGWLRDHSDQLFISAVTVAEIEQGICKLRRSGGAQRADALTLWLDRLIEQGGDRILALDTVTAREAGALSDRALAAGRHPGFADVAIATTARVHSLHLLTLNDKHFAPLGAPFSNPLDGLPSDIVLGLEQPKRT